MNSFFKKKNLDLQEIFLVKKSDLYRNFQTKGSMDLFYKDAHPTRTSLLKRVPFYKEIYRVEVSFSKELIYLGARGEKNPFSVNLGKKFRPLI